MLVLEADRLVSGTRVAGSFRCLRQSILEERFGGKSGRSAVEGTLLHALLQVLPCSRSPPTCCHSYTLFRPLLAPLKITPLRLLLYPPQTLTLCCRPRMYGAGSKKTGSAGGWSCRLFLFQAFL